LARSKKDISKMKGYPEKLLKTKDRIPNFWGYPEKFMKINNLSVRT
jgi:hypothetical protein